MLTCMCFFFQAEDGIRDLTVTGVQTCALPIWLQDNGSWCGPSQTLTRDGIVNEDWQVIHGGDGFYAAIDNVEPWIVYTESQDGYIDRRDLRTAQQRSIRPEAQAGEPHLRFQWDSPGAGSAHQHTTIYY